MPSWIGKSLDLIVYVHKSDYGIHRVRWAMWKTKNDNISFNSACPNCCPLTLISSYLLKTWRNLCRLYTFYSLGTICDIIAVYDIIVDQALYSRFLIVSNLNFLVLSIPVIFSLQGHHLSPASTNLLTFALHTHIFYLLFFSLPFYLPCH